MRVRHVKVLRGNRLAAVERVARSMGQAVLICEVAFDIEREVPHGFVVIKRDIHPFPDKPYALLQWADRRHETAADVYLHSGVYDLDHAGIARVGSEMGRDLYLP